MFEKGQMLLDRISSARYRIAAIQKFKGTTRIGYELELVDTSNNDVPRRLNRFETELKREFEIETSEVVGPNQTMETSCPVQV